MSIFPRADSPPPRSPSPDVILAPLPPPVRRRNRPARLSLQSSDERPKIERPQRSLASMRSCGDLRHPTTPKSASRFIVSAPPTPAPSSPSGSSFRRTHKRTLPFASPYRSPPASPLLSSPPPPVPPIPEFVLSPTDKKPVIHTAPVRVNHIYLPEWEQFTVTPDLASPLPRKKRVSMSPSGRRAVAAPVPEWEQFTVTSDLASPLPRKKRVSMSPSGRRAVAAPAPAAMTCSTFFALHNQSQRPNQVVSL